VQGHDTLHLFPPGAVLDQQLRNYLSLHGHQKPTGVSFILAIDFCNLFLNIIPNFDRVHVLFVRFGHCVLALISGIFTPLRYGSTEPEVTNLRLTVGRYKDVCRLNIPVDHVGHMDES
jgi:hypothetical protein